MPLTVSKAERAALETAQVRCPKVRHWRGYQAVLLRAEGMLVKDVARVLGCPETSIYNWTAAWRKAGAAGVAEGGIGAKRADSTLQLDARWTRSFRKATPRRMAMRRRAGRSRSCAVNWASWAGRQVSALSVERSIGWAGRETTQVRAGASRSGLR